MTALEELKMIAVRVKADSISHFSVGHDLARYHAILTNLIESADEKRAEEIVRQVLADVPELGSN